MIGIIVRLLSTKTEGMCWMWLFVQGSRYMTAKPDVRAGAYLHGTDMIPVNWAFIWMLDSELEYVRGSSSYFHFHLGIVKYLNIWAKPPAFIILGL